MNKTISGSVLGLLLAFGISSVMAAETQPLTKPPKGDGWVSLFDGQSLNGWHLRRQADATNLASWAALNGVLVNIPPSGEGMHGIDLISDVALGSHELYVEFLVPRGSNSGVYLIGQYEIQVYDSYGKEKPNAQDCGSIYDKAAPSMNACLPAGSWQSYHAIIHAPKIENGKVVQKVRITVYQNGKKILDNVEIEGVTGAALKNEVVAEGPTYLQGNHGQVLYRNLFYKKIED